MNNRKEASRGEPGAGGPEIVRTRIPIDPRNGTTALILQEIAAAGGKIPYSRSMHLSLFGPEGYYSQGKADIRREEEGDFPTWAIKEPFNTTVGNSILKVWHSMGQPDTFTILEPGAGTGKMAKDILVWARENHPDFYDAIDYIIVEPGEMQRRQRDTIAQDLHTSVFRPQQTNEADNLRDLKKVRWIQGSAFEVELPEIEGVIVTSEVPDSFAQDKVKNIGGQVKQAYVAEETDEWIEVWDDPTEEVTRYMARHGIVPERDGTEEPININAEKWQRAMDRALRKGAIITIDYGRDGQVGAMNNNKRAMMVFPLKQPEQVPFMEYTSPGNLDITANVNFAALKKIALEDGLNVAFSGDQYDFLFRNGFFESYQGPMQDIMNTGSLSKILDAYRLLLIDQRLVERRNLFYVQALTKGITVDFGDSSTNTSLFPVLDNGLKLRLGSPNAEITVLGVDVDGGMKSLTTHLDEEGNLVFYEKINPVEVFNPNYRWTIMEGNNLVLNTGNRAALRAVVEASGYNYDLPEAA